MSMVEFDRSNSSTSHRPAAGNHYSTQPLLGSPHLQHLDRPSAHSTPSPPYHYAPLPHLVQQHQPPPMRQTPTSYPSPASYTSSIPAYPYTPQSAAQPQPPPPPPPPPSSSSRGSPFAQPASLNLPPIRLNPPQLPPPQHPHEGSPLLGSTLPPPPQSVHNYHQSAGAMVSLAHITSSPHNQPMRYQLPQGPERIMSGGRHKKEIKRRTKTGCLTCRKRRIKCDEAHPTCKNCQKSKRDCLGYDPIFKTQPGPAAIQPAPSSGASTPIPAASSPSLGSYSYAISSVGPGYSHALSGASSPASSCDGFDYIDPALDSATTSHPHLPPSGHHHGHSHHHHHHHHHHQNHPHHPHHSSADTYRPDLKRPLDRTSPFSSASDTNTTTTRTHYTSVPRSSTPGPGSGPGPGLVRHDSQGTAKRIKIDDLLSVGSVSTTPQPLSPPTSELASSVVSSSASVESMKNIYTSRYAPALDDLLEVSWFGTTGANKIWSDGQLAELMAEVFSRFKARGGSYYEEEDPAIRKGTRETDLLWAAVRLCYGTRIPVSDNRRDEHDDDDDDGDGDDHDDHDDEGRRRRRRRRRVNGISGGEEAPETYRRINIIESLLSGQSEYNPVSPRLPPRDQPSSPGSGGQFWYLLEKVANFKVTSPESGREVLSLLEDCRLHVERKPNRELLHAIAELQHLYGEASRPRREALQTYIQGIATDRSIAITRLDRRIAGRAMGLWTSPVTELAFCMPAVMDEGSCR